ncbi:MAG: TolC family protein [Elusimicrobia bacterium]|nr:TolC family protein [Elusimicrobiota bacterium]
MKKYVLLLAACCMALPVAALDPLGAYNTRPPEGCIDKDVTQEELGLEDLIQVSICTNPSLSAQYMGVKASEAAVGASRSQYLPSVTLTGTGNITGERLEHQDYVQGEPYQGKAEASWLLFDFGGRGARIDATKAYFKAADFTYNAELQKLVLSVQTAYLNLLAAQESWTSAKASLATYNQSYNEAKKRYKLGMVSLSDKLQAQTRYEQAELTVVQAANQINQYKGALAVLLNLSPDTEVKLSKPEYDKKFLQLENDNIKSLMATALQERPEIKSSQSQAEAQKANVYTAKTNALPTISAVASASYNDNWKHSNPYATDNAAGLRLSWPLFTGFSNMYNIQQASFEYKQAQHNTDALKRQVENEVWSSYQNYKTAVRSYEISQTILASAEENHRVAFRYYEVGKGDILNLLSAVAQLADARQNKITAFYSVLLNKANLYRSIGKY